MSWRTLLLCSGLGILICSLPTSPLNGPRRLYGTANDRSCQVCHPGATNNLRESIHRTFLVNPATSEQACTICHGDFPIDHDQTLGSVFTSCLSCHTEIHGSNHNRFLFR